MKMSLSCLAIYGQLSIVPNLLPMIGHWHSTYTIIIKKNFTNTDSKWEFDILAFERNLRRWERDYLKVSWMAMGLLLLKEQFKSLKDREKSQPDAKGNLA